MAIPHSLKNRSQDTCELCSSKNELFAFDVPPVTGNPDDTIAICLTCQLQIERKQSWMLLIGNAFSNLCGVKCLPFRLSPGGC